MTQKSTKSKEEIQKERFLKMCPTRLEMMEYINGVSSELSNNLTTSTALMLGTIKRILIEKEICTDEDFNRVYEEVMNQYTSLMSKSEKS